MPIIRWRKPTGTSLFFHFVRPDACLVAIISTGDEKRQEALKDAGSRTENAASNSQKQVTGPPIDAQYFDQKVRP